MVTNADHDGDRCDGRKHFSPSDLRSRGSDRQLGTKSCYDPTHTAAATAYKGHPPLTFSTHCRGFKGPGAAGQGLQTSSTYKPGLADHTLSLWAERNSGTGDSVIHPFLFD